MLYILDTAKVEDIRHAVEYYPVDGVTTNPTIISKENTNFSKLTKDIRKTIGNERMLHIQVTGDTAEQMVKEATALQYHVGGNFYAKIPTCPEGIKAMQLLKKDGVKITATAIFTPQQAMLAAKAGADFVAPYVNRLDNIVSDGVHVVAEITEMFRQYAIDTKVLAASFKNVEQVHKIAMVGGHAVTISPELLELLLYHPLTNYAIDDFNVDWESVYGKKGILEVLKESE